MKRVYRVLLLLALFLLVGCTASNERAVNDLMSVLRSPELRSLPLEGIWQVTHIIERDQNEKIEATRQVGDNLYIDSEMVAFGDAVTVSPTFSSKSVKLQDYLSMRYIKEDFGVDPESNVFITMIREADLFSMDLILLPNRHLAYISGSHIYVLEQTNGVVPAREKERIRQQAKGDATRDQETSYASHITTVLSLRTKKISDSGIAYYDYASYLVADHPELDRPLVYKMDQLFVYSADNIAWLLDYTPQEADNNNGVMNGTFTFHSTRDTDRDNQQVLFDQLGRGITFIDGNTISFDKPSQYPAQKDTPKKYEIQRLDKLSEDRPLTVTEIGGEKESEGLKQQVNAQLEFLDPAGEVDPKLFPVDEANIGIVRRNLNWGFVTSMNWRVGDKLFPSLINIELVPLVKMFNAPSESISWTRVTNKVPLATTASSSPASDRLWIKTEDELLYYRSTASHIEDHSLLSLQIGKDAELIGVRFFYDEQGKQVQEQFIKQDLTPPQVLYTEANTLRQVVQE